MAGEAVSDAQLTRFKATHSKGAICDVGPWSRSRHPNYFFEWLFWVALPFFGIAVLPDYPWGWGALMAPAIMYWLLAHVSGVPPLEAHMLRSRGDAFREYQRRVPAFWPRLTQPR
jgi:steroid 5-alpha reductase family enzyme